MCTGRMQRMSSLYLTPGSLGLGSLNEADNGCPAPVPKPEQGPCSRVFPVRSSSTPASTSAKAA